jgi:hypothetical protein
MKLKDLEDNVNLKNVRVKLSENMYLSSSLPKYNIKSREVYLAGNMMGDFFVKTDPKSTQIYPMFNDLLSWNELKELEVIES